MIVVAIDGPVGSGKSTVARAVAARLGLEHLETGAMYRAVALAAHRAGLDPAESPEEVAALAGQLRIEVGERVVVDGEDVTAEVRSRPVGALVSAVAAVPAVRAELVRLQREWAARRNGGVLEGRDIGSVVFPDAQVKVFLTAAPEERARRRQEEGADAVRRRDDLDSARAVSPLVVPPGAMVIDSTGREVDEVVEQIVGLVR